MARVRPICPLGFSARVGRVTRVEGAPFQRPQPGFLLAFVAASRRMLTGVSGRVLVRRRRAGSPVLLETGGSVNRRRGGGSELGCDMIEAREAVRRDSNIARVSSPDRETEYDSMR